MPSLVEPYPSQLLKPRSGLTIGEALLGWACVHLEELGDEWLGGNLHSWSASWTAVYTDTPGDIMFYIFVLHRHSFVYIWIDTSRRVYVLKVEQEGESHVHPKDTLSGWLCGVRKCHRGNSPECIAGYVFFGRSKPCRKSDFGYNRNMFFYKEPMSKKRGIYLHGRGVLSVVVENFETCAVYKLEQGKAPIQISMMNRLCKQLIASSDTP